ncbi:hypothetical protein QSV34_12335 [Porticoccus sp. W117]|uniref:hypothetical protein n=1 Tax=Porticoccus sp. W117 TaxID=3054777 RepID=UPI002596823C|nr:hypothetical protein [Porticoccus sp. W117]MDM3872134.1 hypothetical protein [Porticoccus sp. W117]
MTVFWVVGVFLGVTVFVETIYLWECKDYWKFRDLLEKLPVGFIATLAAIYAFILIVPDAKLENIEPYPHLKLFGYAAMMSLVRSLDSVRRQAQKGLGYPEDQ